jgi:hypothetical protein
MANTIDFQAKADGVFSTMDKITEKSKAMFDQEVQNAAKYETSIRNQIKLLEEKAKILDQNAKKAQQSVREYTDSFDSSKQKKLDSLEKELVNIGNRKKTLKLEYDGGKGEMSAQEYKDAAKELSGEKSRITSIRDNVAKSTPQQQEQYSLTKEQARDTKRIASSFKEQLEATKQQGKDLAKAIYTGDDEVANEIRSTADNKEIVERIAKDELEHKKKKEESSGSKIGDITSTLLDLGMLTRFIGTISSFSGTQNGFDQIATVRKSEGEIIGAIGGAIVGGILGSGFGAAAGASFGSQIGGSIGGGVGTVEQRGKMSIQELQSNYFQRRALTGQQDYNSPLGMSSLGVGPSQYVQMQMDMARAQGTSKNLEGNTNSGIYFEKVYGVQQSTSASISELLRSSKEGTRDLGSLLGGILKAGEGNLFKGGDRTFFNEFLNKNFTTIQRELLKTQATVATGTTFDILKRFDSVGGQFSARDSRSTGLISTIQNSLSNPQSDIAKAIRFDILRQLHPNMSQEQLLEEGQKGLSSPGLMRALISRVRGMGGSMGNQVMNFAGLTGLEGNLSAARNLYQHGGVFNQGLSQSNLAGGGSAAALRKAAEDNTTQISKATAGIEEHIMRGLSTGSEYIYNAIVAALNGATVKVVNDRIQIVPGGVKTNVTYSPSGTSNLFFNPNVFKPSKHVSDAETDSMLKERGRAAAKDISDNGFWQHFIPK